MCSEKPPPKPVDQLLPEIIDKIIDFVQLVDLEGSHIGSHTDLSTCALVSKSFLSRSQMRLFSEILLPARRGSVQLEVGDYTSRLSSLIDILDKNPGLAEYIQELHLVLPKGDPSWMCNNQELQTIMERITSTKVPLQKLKITSTLTMGPFKILNPDSFIQFIDFFRQAIAPYITTLRLEFMSDVPPEVLAVCTNLRNLSLKFITVLARSPNLLKFDLSTPRIEQLEYNSIDEPSSLSYIFSDDHPTFDFSGLRSLTTYADDSVRSLDLTQRIIDSAKGSLENLVITMSPREEILSVPSTVLSLKGHQNLRSITHIAFFKTPGRNGLLDTCMTLKTIDTTQLKRFHLIMCVNDKAETLLRAGDWKTFTQEVLRVCSGIKTGKMKLFLDIHYYAPSEWVPAPWSSPNMGPRGYMEHVLDKLINGRLSMLENSSRIRLERKITVVDYPEDCY